MSQQATLLDVERLFAMGLSPEVIANIEQRLAQLKSDSQASSDEQSETDAAASDQDDNADDDGGSDADSADSQLYGNYVNPFGPHAYSDDDTTDSDGAPQGRGRETFDAPDPLHYQGHAHCPPLPSTADFDAKYPCDCAQRSVLILIALCLN